MSEENPVPEPKALPTIDVATEKLAAFFEGNPSSTIVNLENADGFEILNPWNDASIALEITDGFDEIADTLNMLVLPERFTAIWHKDSKWLEVIWTAYHLPESQLALKDRQFKFLHKGKEHRCNFGMSSERLMAVAKHAAPKTISESNHRNIQSFAAYVHSRVRDGLGEPRSFWISDVEWDEAETIDLVTHLNFYMKYFDILTPVVVINSSINEPVIPQKARFIKGSFPDKIESLRLDENLMSFWSFANSGNPMLRFLLYYRILEYAAHHFISDEIREELRKLLLAPDLRSDMARSIGAMVGAMGASKLSDAQRLRALMRKVVSPSLLWRDLEANSDFFSKDTKFDGGFTIRAPIGKGDKEESFGCNGVERVSDRFRDIRNALSHGKDQETSGVIRPTTENAHLFGPWVHLIATAAGEVVLYGTTT